MGKTVYRQGIEKTVKEKISSNGEWASMLFEIKDKMDTGFFDQRWIDALGQPFMRRGYDIYDAFCFISMWHKLLSGQIAHAPIGPIGVPGNDSATERNNDGLKNLPCPFKAEFIGGSGDCDGYLEWTDEIVLAQNNQSWSMAEYRVAPNRWVPLEVGHTAFERTYDHICHDRGVARWPYNSRVVWLFIPAGDWIFELHSF